MQSNCSRRNSKKKKFLILLPQTEINSSNPIEEISHPKAETKPAVSEPKPEIIKKSTQPLAKESVQKASKFSITQHLEKSAEVKEEENHQSKESLPSNHFTETDLQEAWKNFLEDIVKEDVVIYNAIAGFHLEKSDENKIKISFPSHSAKSEFDKVSSRFLNTFRHQVNNYLVEAEFHFDGQNLKREVETKRTLFEKFVKINPAIQELDNIFKLDLN